MVNGPFILRLFIFMSVCVCACTYTDTHTHIQEWSACGGLKWVSDTLELELQATIQTPDSGSGNQTQDL